MNPATSSEKNAPVSAEEIHHLHQHVKMYWKFIFFFFLISLIAVLCSPYFIDLSRAGNLYLAYALLTVRCGVIAYFFACLFGEFLVISRFFFLTIFFLIGMIGLSVWSQLNPITNLNDHYLPPKKAYSEFSKPKS